MEERMSEQPNQRSAAPAIRWVLTTASACWSTASKTRDRDARSHGARRQLECRAERIKGYSTEEIVGRHFSASTPESIQRGMPEHELKTAARDGRFEDERARA